MKVVKVYTTFNDVADKVKKGLPEEYKDYSVVVRYSRFNPNDESVEFICAIVKDIEETPEVMETKNLRRFKIEI